MFLNPSVVFLLLFFAIWGMLVSGLIVYSMVMNIRYARKKQREGFKAYAVPLGTADPALAVAEMIRKDVNQAIDAKRASDLLRSEGIRVEDPKGGSQA